MTPTEKSLNTIVRSLERLADDIDPMTRGPERTEVILAAARLRSVVVRLGKPPD